MAKVNYTISIQRIAKRLKERGIRITFGTDFQWLKAELKLKSHRHDLLRQFDPDGVLHKSRAAFWIVGHNQRGDLMFTQAEQLLNLRGGSVRQYLCDNCADYAPAAPPVEVASIRISDGPRVRNLCGAVVYSGETWLRKEIRDRGTANLVVLLGAFTAGRVWNPDAIFGLMNWSLVSSGFNSRVGFLHAEPKTMRWIRSDTGREHQVWLVYTTNDDLQFLTTFDFIEYSKKLSCKDI